MDQFTKQVNAMPMRTANNNVINSIKQYIIYISGLLETIMANQGFVFTGQDILAFVKKINL